MSQRFIIFMMLAIIVILGVLLMWGSYVGHDLVSQVAAETLKFAVGAFFGALTGFLPHKPDPVAPAVV